MQKEGSQHNEVQGDLSKLQKHLAETIGLFKRNKDGLQKLGQLHEKLSGIPQDLSNYDIEEKQRIKKEADEITSLIKELVPELKSLENSLSNAANDVGGLANELENDQQMIEDMKEAEQGDTGQEPEEQEQEEDAGAGI